MRELGIEKISIYESKVFELSKLIESIQSKYAFLSEIIDLTEQVVSILQVHHKSSFFNKPPVSYSNGSITVGQVHNV